MIINEQNIRELAVLFTDALKSRMSEDDFKEMKRRNAENAQYNQRCASHDFCDANAAMVEALKKLGIPFNFEDADQWILINRAWALARSEKMI